MFTFTLLSKGVVIWQQLRLMKLLLIFIHRFHCSFVFWDYTCIATFTWRFMSVCITLKNFFGAAVNAQCKYILNTKITSFFFLFPSNILVLAAVFSFKVSSLCKTVKPNGSLCSFVTNFKYSAVLFPVPHNQDYHMIIPFSYFLLTLISPQIPMPLPHKSIFEMEERQKLSLSLTLLLEFIEVSDFEA